MRELQRKLDTLEDFIFYLFGDCGIDEYTVAHKDFKDIRIRISLSDDEYF